MLPRDSFICRMAICLVFLFPSGQACVRQFLEESCNRGNNLACDVLFQLWCYEQKSPRCDTLEIGLKHRDYSSPGYALGVNSRTANCLRNSYDLQIWGNEIQSEALDGPDIPDPPTVTLGLASSHRWPVAYQILYEEPFVTFKGLSCSITQTQIVHRCQGDDHVGRALDHFHRGLPYPVTAEECQHMRDSNTFLDPYNRSHPVSLSNNNVVEYVSHGKMGDTWDDPQCVGVAWSDPLTKDVMDAVVIVTRLLIVLEETTYVSKGDKMKDLRTNLFVPCDTIRKDCLIDGRLHVWDQIHILCPTVLLHMVQGEEQEDDGKVVFLSTDGSSLKIMKGPPAKPTCGYKLYSTDQPGIFVVRHPFGTPSGAYDLLHPPLKVLDQGVYLLGGVIGQMRQAYLEHQLKNLMTQVHGLQIAEFQREIRDLIAEGRKEIIPILQRVNSLIGG